MNNSQEFHTNFEELFALIKPDIKDTLTTEQIAAIKKVFSYNNWTRQHDLDLRVTLPIPGLRFYIWLIGGTEQRSKQRLQRTQVLYPVWTVNNIIFVIGFCATLSIFAFTISSSILSLISSEPNLGVSSSPTSIPWILDKSDCEDTGRVWNNRKCWDNEHNSMF